MLLMSSDAPQRRQYLRILLGSPLVVEIFVNLGRYYTSTISEITEEVVAADRAQGSSTSPLHLRNMRVLDAVVGIGRQAAISVRRVLTQVKHFPSLCLKISLRDTKDFAEYIDSLINDEGGMSSHWLFNSKVMGQVYGKQLICSLFAEVQQISIGNGNNSVASIEYASKCLRCLSVLAFFSDSSELYSHFKTLNDTMHSMFHPKSNDNSEAYTSLYRNYVCFLYGLLSFVDSSSVSTVQYALQRILLLSSSSPDESYDAFFQFAFIIATMSMNIVGLEDIYCQILRVSHSFGKQFTNRSALLLKDAFQAINPITCVHKVFIKYHNNYQYNAA